MHCSHLSTSVLKRSGRDNLQKDVLISTDLANEYKQLLQNLKHEDLSKPWGTSSYSYVAMKEKQYLESPFLCICQRSGLPSLFRFSHTHTQADTVV